MFKRAMNSMNLLDSWGLAIWRTLKHKHDFADWCKKAITPKWVSLTKSSANKKKKRETNRATGTYEDVKTWEDSHWTGRKKNVYTDESAWESHKRCCLFESCPQDVVARLYEIFLYKWHFQIIFNTWTLVSFFTVYCMFIFSKIFASWSLSEWLVFKVF
jgi:hypothetical protein